jgi:hypothetical protein
MTPIEINKSFLNPMLLESDYGLGGIAFVAESSEFKGLLSRPELASSWRDGVWRGAKSSSPSVNRQAGLSVT